LLLIIVAAVVALVLIGGGAFFMLKKNTAHDDEDGGDEVPAKEQKAKKAKKDHGAPPVFVKLEAFTVKLQTENQEAYLQAVPELRVLDAHTGDTIKQYNPEIRHKVLLILSGKKASDLTTPQGVQKLSNEMRVAINGIIEPPPPRKKGGKEPEEPGDQANPDEPVQAVLFTSFIVQ
jgi:flagellar FliL protein